jgi:hypothetical protein
MLITAALLLGFTVAQSTIPQNSGTLPAQTSGASDKTPPKQALPSKSDPQGYSPDMFDEPKQADSAKANAPKAIAQTEAVPADLADIVTKQFGEKCTASTTRSSLIVHYAHPSTAKWDYFFTADVNHDGIPDAIIVARCKDVLAGQGEHKYKVVDPYFTYHGYGDPKITATLGTEDPTHGNMVLVIHGAGAEAWRAAEPKAKFVMINLPFDDLGLMIMEARKIHGAALELLTLEEQNSIVYWDGKKYVWREMSAAQ